MKVIAGHINKMILGQKVFCPLWYTDFSALRASEILKHSKSAHFSTKNAKIYIWLTMKQAGLSFYSQKSFSFLHRRWHRMQRLYHPRHIASQMIGNFHSFRICQNLLWCVSMHHTPVAGGSERLLTYQRILLKHLQGRCCPAAPCRHDTARGTQSTLYSQESNLCRYV